MSTTNKPKSRTIKPRLISSADAARMLGVEPDTFRGRATRGFAPLPFTRQGNMYYYKIADIEFFCDHGHWPDGMAWENQLQPSGDEPCSGFAVPSEKPSM